MFDRVDFSEDEKKKMGKGENDGEAHLGPSKSFLFKMRRKLGREKFDR